MRKPSKRMTEILMDCHERELLKLEPGDISNIKYAKGLIQRGMLKTHNVITEKGKRIVGFYVTLLGVDYLRKL